MEINKKITLLRSHMKDMGFDAIIIPTSDAHQSEYVPDFAKEREWISGFTGSAGTAIITHAHAALWTDARYSLQAEEELKDCYFQLHKHEKRFTPQHYEWLKDQLDKGAKVAINMHLFTVNDVKSLLNIFSPKEITLHDMDLIGQIWNDRPPKSHAPIEELPINYAGRSRINKLQMVRDQMKKDQSDVYVITALDEIAWITNLRGSDVSYNPVFLSYMTVSHDSAILFVDSYKLDAQLTHKLKEDGINIKPYGSIHDYVATLNPSCKVIMDYSLVSQSLKAATQAQVSHVSSIIHDLKGIKNEIELSNWTEAMVADGVALIKTFYWLEQELINEIILTEHDLAQKLEINRGLHKNYRGASFGSIVGYEANGASMHYHPTATQSKIIKNTGILLCDSGGQYLTGTTDVTRTLALGSPDKKVKHHYTLVLKGMIALTKSIFPEGTSGGQLDLLARQYLWQEGLDFKHGTGHGVGYYLNVHEGPAGFADIKTAKGKKPLEAGMVLTNEPGFYLDQHYGIRIENMMVVTKAKYDGFLTFQTMTLCPIDQSLMDETILSASEKAWINQYHHQVFEACSPYIDDTDIYEWLKRKCKPLN